MAAAFLSYRRCLLAADERPRSHLSRKFRLKAASAALPGASSTTAVGRQQPPSPGRSCGGLKAGCSQGVGRVGFVTALAMGIAYVCKPEEFVNFDGPLEHVVGNATKAGVKKFLLPERHHAGENFDYQTRVDFAVVGAKPDKAPVKLAYEADFDVADPRGRR